MNVLYPGHIWAWIPWLLRAKLEVVVGSCLCLGYIQAFYSLGTKAQAGA